MVTAGACQGPMSDVYAFRDSVVTGINGPVDSSQLIIYGPNPVKNELRIDFHMISVTSVYVEMCDLKGSIYRRWANVVSGTPLNVAGVPSGVYFVRVFNDKGRLHRTIKILKD